ncbi:MAG: molybdate ABC transporter substrate-binding protein [Proteobacteria bacterium]|nr:molybdate ABC transporter substrate-binding protein [Pseudomonadota bacterium]MBU1059851.1 molybdate ABC transporter substrate-binding protein [Pseudomonadota bacterium]
MSKRMIALALLLVLGVCMLFVVECDPKDKTLIVYVGKGMQKAMEEVQAAFEQKHDIILNIIYAGSATCLSTIRDTGRGDVFVPGSVHIFENAPDLIDNHQYVALHVPMVCIHKDNPKEIRSFDDLAKPGVRISVGNTKMCSMGGVADAILSRSAIKEGITKNIVIRSPTVVELLNLVVRKEVDAAIIWKDTMYWPELKNLKGIEIPPEIIETTEIRVAVLTSSEHKESAQLFADFVASEGKTIFKEHGFSEK